MAQRGGSGSDRTAGQVPPRAGTVRPLLRRLGTVGAATILAATAVMSGATPPEAPAEPAAEVYLGEPPTLETAQVTLADEPQMGLSRIPVSVTLAKLPGPDPFDGANPADPVCASYPVEPGRFQISSPYGYRIHPIFGSYAMHAGVDFAAPLGTAIHAVTDGTVVYTGAGRLGRSSELVILEHTVGDTTFYSWYVHMYPDGVFVEVGQQVRAGEVIAEVGNNGNSTGPHLHFEIHTEDVVRSTVPRTSTAKVTALLSRPASATGDDALDPGDQEPGDESEEPTDGPDGDESEDPTGEPDDEESEEPKGGSDDDESQDPTDSPDGDESEDPTGEPDDEESEKPTGGPDDDESQDPTGEHDGEPGTEDPTAGPDDGESEEPTAGPDDGESEGPTDGPGVGESEEPTRQPTTPAPDPGSTDRPGRDRPGDGSAGGRPAAPTAPGQRSADPSGSLRDRSDRAGGQGRAGESARHPFPVRAFGTTVEPMDFLRSLGLELVAPGQCLAP